MVGVCGGILKLFQEPVKGVGDCDGDRGPPAACDVDGGPPAPCDGDGGPAAACDGDGGPPAACDGDGGTPAACDVDGGPPAVCDVDGGPPAARNVDGGPLAGCDRDGDGDDLALNGPALTPMLLPTSSIKVASTFICSLVSPGFSLYSVESRERALSFV